MKWHITHTLGAGWLVIGVLVLSEVMEPFSSKFTSFMICLIMMENIFRWRYT